MRVLIILVTCLALGLVHAGPSAAQSDNDAATDTPTEREDRGRLQAFLEDSLSAPGRDIRIEGFQGALSRRATIESISIADSEGVWLTLNGAVLDWNRSALLRGALVVNELSARELIVERRPVPADTGVSPANLDALPTAEATPFTLPDLPVSIDVAVLDIGTITLGEGVLGEAAELTLNGQASLDDGAGAATLALNRTDGTQGEFTVAGEFSNETRVLALQIALNEAAGGLAANALQLPDRPAVTLRVGGTGPLSDYTAQIELATDGERRLSGDVGLRGQDDGGNGFFADVAGDIRPLVEEQYRRFFGPELRLDVAGAQPPEGGLRLDRFALAAEEIQLNGALELGVDGWPARLDVTGRIAARDGSPVLLSLPGAETRLQEADLALQYDAAEGDEWQLALTVDALDRPDLKVGRMQLSGSGTLTQGDGSPVGAVAGGVDLDITGLDFDDPALLEAVGPALTGRLQFDAAEGAPLELTGIDLRGDDYGLTGDLTITTDMAAPSVDVAGAVQLTAERLARFATLAGQPLTGAADLTVDGRFGVLDSSFDLRATGTTQDISIGQDRLDPLIGGRGELTLIARRDATGTVVEQLRMLTREAEIAANANLTSATSSGRVQAAIRDTALIAPEMAGRGTLDVTFEQTGPDWTVTGTATGPGGVDLALDGEALVADAQVRLVSGSARVRAADVSPYGWIAAREIGGAVDLTVEGQAAPVDRTFAVTLSGTVSDVITGIDRVDPLLRGATRLDAAVRSDTGGVYVIERLDVDGAQARINGQATIAPDASNGEIRAAINDTGLLAPEMSGPGTVDVTFSQTGADWTLAGTATGPGGADIRLDGTAEVVGTDIRRVGGTARVQATSLAPYGWIAQRDIGGGIDLTIEGQATPPSEQFTVAVNGTLTDVTTGVAQADLLLRGTSRVDAAVRGEAGNVFVIDTLDVTTPQISADATGSVGPERSRVRFNVDLGNIGLFVPDFDGPLAGQGVVATTGDGPWTVDTSLVGPGNIRATVQGDVARDASTANLSINGSAPLGLANQYIRPNLVLGEAAFDLRLNGPLNVSSLTGTVRSQGARVAVPSARLSLEDIGATVQFINGRAQLRADAAVASGGRLSIAGPVTLSAPFNADLDIRLLDIALADPPLYETTVNGQVGIRGPLTGGANIAGALALGTVELRIPSSFGGGGEGVDGLQHRNEPADVRRTRVRAGLVESGGGNGGGGAGGGSGPGFGLDIRVDAPARIFIRGRGVDAELGGSLRLSGTTNNVITQGRFDLIRGRLDILGKRLDLTEASATLQGDFDPFVRIVAETSADDTAIRLVIEGPVSELELRLSSTPELPEDEILSRLLFGRGLTEISPFQALQLASAVRTLAGKGGGGIVDGLRNQFGLDDLDITTTDSGETGLRAGKYLSENVYSDVTVDSTGQTDINLNLQITPNLTGRGTVGSDGNTGVGIYFEKDY